MFAKPTVDTKTNWIGEDFEEKIKQFNDKFVENLTLSLTAKLGLDLKETKENAEMKRKKTIGESFIESKSPGLKNESNIASPFGAFGPT